MLISNPAGSRTRWARSASVRRDISAAEAPAVVEPEAAIAELETIVRTLAPAVVVPNWGRVDTLPDDTKRYNGDNPLPREVFDHAIARAEHAKHKQQPTAGSLDRMHAQVASAREAEQQAPGQLVEQAVKNLGGIDLLVTNSGGPPGGPFESLAEEQWMQAINLIFLSHVRLIRAALPYLKQSDAASVLTMTSWTVKYPMPNLVLSNSIRSATIGLTKTLALELGGQGIRFNSILPAAMNTDRMRELQSMRARRNGTTAEEEAAKDASSSVFGRMGKPEEFANVAVFLLSPAASYVTGLMMTVDGGQYRGTF